MAADDERRAEIETMWAEVRRALGDARTRATPDHPEVKVYWCERIGLALDRVRDARGDEPRAEAAEPRCSEIRAETIAEVERLLRAAEPHEVDETDAAGVIGYLRRHFAAPRARNDEGEEHETDGMLHLWECPHVLNGDNPDFERCGFIARGDKGTPGFCPYDHGDRVQLVPLLATVLCSDCAIPILRDDCRADDGRLVCGDCAMSYIETENEG